MHHLKTFILSFYYASTRSALGVLLQETRYINWLLSSVDGTFFQQWWTIYSSSIAIFVHPALLLSLEKEGDGVAHSCNCQPPHGLFVSCWRTCVLLQTASLPNQYLHNKVNDIISQKNQSNFTASSSKRIRDADADWLDGKSRIEQIGL